MAFTEPFSTLKGYLSDPKTGKLKMYKNEFQMALSMISLIYLYLYKESPKTPFEMIKEKYSDSFDFRIYSKYINIFSSIFDHKYQFFINKFYK